MRHYAPWLQKRNFDMIDQIRGSWNLIKETIRNEYDLSDISFSTWIEPLQFSDLQDDMVVILIPSDQSHALNYISSKYKNYFKVTISSKILCNSLANQYSLPLSSMCLMFSKSILLSSNLFIYFLLIYFFMNLNLFNTFGFIIL